MLLRWHARAVLGTRPRVTPPVIVDTLGSQARHGHNAARRERVAAASGHAAMGGITAALRPAMGDGVDPPPAKKTCTMLDMAKPKYACVEPLFRGDIKFTDPKCTMNHPGDMRCKQQTLCDM